MLVIFGAVFAMAKIRKIGHDLHTLFWGSGRMKIQAVTGGENKLPYIQYTSDLKYVPRFGKPIKKTTRGAPLHSGGYA